MNSERFGSNYWRNLSVRARARDELQNALADLHKKQSGLDEADSRLRRAALEVEMALAGEGIKATVEVVESNQKDGKDAKVQPRVQRRTGKGKDE